jgi:hypothetical protein
MALTKVSPSMQSRDFESVTSLLADTVLAYAGTGTEKAVAGDTVVTRSEGFSYTVAASGATDQHVTTAGGVKLYVLRGGGGFNAKAFSATGLGVADDTAALQKFIDACEEGAGFIPFGVYNHTGLTMDPSKSYNITGEAYDGDAVGGSVLQNTNAVGGHGITIDNTPFTGNFDSQMRLANMTLKGNINSGDGMYVQQTMVQLENVWITGNGGRGYRAQLCYSSSFRQVVFANNYGTGFSALRALNAVHFDHCIFNGNARDVGVSDNAGCSLSGDPGQDRNFGVVFTSCDFTGNGNELVGAETAFGLVVRFTAGVTLVGCYGENNKTNILYSDSTTSNLTITGCFWQDSTVQLLKVDGLIYENNHHYDSGGLTTVLIIDGGSDIQRTNCRLYGNTYFGTVNKVFTNGAGETQTFRASAVPTVGSYLKGDRVINIAANAPGSITGWTCIAAGTPGTWVTDGVLPGVFGDQGDVSQTLTAGGGSFSVNIWASPLTANRTVTLSTVGVWSGAKFRITRLASSTGAFNLVIGSTGKNLTTGQWCDVEYQGLEWAVTAFGSL